MAMPRTTLSRVHQEGSSRKTHYATKKIMTAEGLAIMKLCRGVASWPSHLSSPFFPPILPTFSLLSSIFSSFCFFFFPSFFSCLLSFSSSQFSSFSSFPHYSCFAPLVFLFPFFRLFLHFSLSFLFPLLKLSLLFISFVLPSLPFLRLLLSLFLLPPLLYGTSACFFSPPIGHPARTVFAFVAFFSSFLLTVRFELYWFFLLPPLLIVLRASFLFFFSDVFLGCLFFFSVTDYKAKLMNDMQTRRLLWGWYIVALPVKSSRGKVVVLLSVT